LPPSFPASILLLLIIPFIQYLERMVTKHPPVTHIDVGPPRSSLVAHFIGGRREVELIIVFIIVMLSARTCSAVDGWPSLSRSSNSKPLQPRPHQTAASSSTAACEGVKAHSSFSASSELLLETQQLSSEQVKRLISLAVPDPDLGGVQD